MTSEWRDHLAAANERSPYILTRRRKLFPAADGDPDSDLGHISPIGSDNSDNEQQPEREREREQEKKGRDTPSTGAVSPTQNHKTPNDSSTKQVLTKEQKLLLEESKSSMKRKTEPKSSKVRTALFPPEPLVPAKTFYPKDQEDVVERLKRQNDTFLRRPPYVARAAARSGGRRPSPRKKLGEINNGVRHKIRKPRRRGDASKRAIERRLSKTAPALNRYLRDLAELTRRQQSDRKQISEIGATENKENEDGRRKRPRSPPCDDDDAVPKRPKKFFRAKEEAAASRRPSLDWEAPNDDDAAAATTIDIDNILLTLSNDEDVIGRESVAPPDARQRTTSSDGGNDVANMIMSPISQMCDVTSGLALNSPQGGAGGGVSKLLTTVSSRTCRMLSFAQGPRRSVDNNKEERPKFYPVFARNASSGLAAATTANHKPDKGGVGRKDTKTLKRLPPDQMLLDAGQKRFGLTFCYECDMLYHMGDPNQEIEHEKYHNAHHSLNFAGWKNERVVANFQNGSRIIKVLPTDQKVRLTKVQNLMELINRELGCYEVYNNLREAQAYMYIKRNVIAGCAIAVLPKGQGHRMLSTNTGVALCSEESFPIKCGISHIWVATHYRKQGIASALLDAVKSTFLYGEILANDDIALTSPTEAGCAFAEKYFKTPNFLVYYI